MTSDPPREAYVWTWLPGRVEPVVAGRLDADGDRFTFIYGRSYLERDDAVPLFEPELPLKRGIQPPAPGLSIANCIRDAAPDAWGRRVIVNRRFGARREAIDVGRLDELTYLLESGSDRIGALDFQASATDYRPRDAVGAPLEDLMQAADRVQAGTALTSTLDQVLFHGSSIGGARPKANIEQGERKFIAKFSTRSDVFDVVRGEYVAMRLARRVGLDVASVRLVQAAGRDVLLVERFDRLPAPRGWTRRAMVSALTLLGLDEMMARYASYQDLCDIVRRRFRAPRETLRELFGRMVFNILVGNTDDHARNHAAFWHGDDLSLTPAYDICPQGRAGGEASQAMLLTGDQRRSQIALCLDSAPAFMLDRSQALALVTDQVDALIDAWGATCDEAGLSDIDRRVMWRRQILNPYAFEGLDGPLGALARPDVAV